MAATWRQRPAGSPRRFRAVVARGSGVGEGVHARAGPASASGPEARRRPAGSPVPFFFFFLKFFSKLFSKHLLTYLKVFSDFASKTKVVQNNFLYNFALKCNPNSK
jgi:hypothetical protein